MFRRRIPQVVIPRLSLYYRAILEQGKEFISSEELAGLTQFKPAQVRRDIAYFGQFGTTGIGYNSTVLKNTIMKILGLDREWKVMLVGVGNLGSALLSYKGFIRQGFKISYAFDKDPRRIGRQINSIIIKDIKDLPKTIKRHNIKIAIVTVPSQAAQEVANKLINCGVKAILNFAPIKLRVPKNVVVLNIDLSIELEKLAYFLA